MAALPDTAGDGCDSNESDYSFSNVVKVKKEIEIAYRIGS